MSPFLVTDAGQWSLFILRLALGIVIFPHGMQKLLGWFGGHGFKGTMGYLTGQAKLPWIVACLVVMAESFGSIGLIVGLLTRLAALGIGLTMLGAAWTVHRKHGFFMNWTGQQPGEGYEFHILAAAIALVLVIWGAGALSLDGLLFSSAAR
ncbi:MAG: DoxX family protein [SAR324 cluster bacterium]